MINKNYQRYYTIQNNYQRPNVSALISNQINQRNYSQKNINLGNDFTAYANNNNTYQNQMEQSGYSASNGIYDLGTMLFINSNNFISQYEKVFPNNNKNMYQNNNMINSGQNIQQFNDQNYQQVNNSGQNIQQFNNQNYQQVNNSGQNMQQNYYNQNSQNIQQNNYNINSQRNNFDFTNMQQQIMNNNQNMQNNNNNLNSQSNYNPNIDYFNNNNQNNYQNAQRNQYIAIPQKKNDNINFQNLQYNNQSQSPRRYNQNQINYNNAYLDNQMNINNYQNYQNYQNNQIPNQFINTEYNNQQYNNNQISNQNINVIRQPDGGENINNYPNYFLNNNQQQQSVENHQKYLNNENDIQNLANDLENKLKIVQNNQNNREQNEKDNIDGEKHSEDLINKIINLEDDNIMSVAESINMEDIYNKKINQINNNKETNIPNNQDSTKESINLRIVNDHMPSDSNTINNNINKDKYNDVNKEDDNPYLKDIIKDYDNDNPHLKDNNNENNNIENLFPLNYSKAIYTLDDNQVKNNDNQFVENNKNVKEEEKKVQVGNDISFGNLNNNSLFSGGSVLESVQITDEMPNDIHNHPLSNGPINNEKCTICNEERSCDKGYRCYQCPLVICDKCANNIRVEYYYNFKHGHPLYLINEGNRECNICQRQTNFITFFFNCRRCNYNICLNCFTPERKKDDYTLHEHPLKYYNDSNPMKCQICEKEAKCGYKCNICKVELCQECAYNIFSQNKRYELHNHPLYLTLRDRWNCTKCQCGFRNNISFSCKNCYIDICVKCFLE